MTRFRQLPEFSLCGFTVGSTCSRCVSVRDVRWAKWCSRPYLKLAPVSSPESQGSLSGLSELIRRVCARGLVGGNTSSSASALWSSRLLAFARWTCIVALRDASLGFVINLKLGGGFSPEGAMCRSVSGWFVRY